MLFQPAPKIIVLHLGGNDLVNKSIFQIQNSINREIKYIRVACPNTILIWVDIIQRRTWQGAVQHMAIEHKRRRINRIGRTSVLKGGPGDHVSCDILASENFFRPDGVHLNDVGLEFYLDHIRDAILKYK